MRGRGHASQGPKQHPPLNSPPRLAPYALPRRRPHRKRHRDSAPSRRIQQRSTRDGRRSAGRNGQRPARKERSWEAVPFRPPQNRRRVPQSRSRRLPAASAISTPPRPPSLWPKRGSARKVGVSSATPSEPAQLARVRRIPRDRKSSGGRSVPAASFFRPVRPGSDSICAFPRPQGAIPRPGGARARTGVPRPAWAQFIYCTRFAANHDLKKEGHMSHIALRPPARRSRARAAKPRCYRILVSTAGGPSTPVCPGDGRGP